MIDSTSSEEQLHQDVCVWIWNLTTYLKKYFNIFVPFLDLYFSLAWPLISTVSIALYLKFFVLNSFWRNNTLLASWQLYYLWMRGQNFDLVWYIVGSHNSCWPTITHSLTHPKYDSNETENKEVVDWKQNDIGPVSSQ